MLNLTVEVMPIADTAWKSWHELRSNLIDRFDSPQLLVKPMYYGLQTQIGEGIASIFQGYLHD